MLNQIKQIYTKPNIENIDRDVKAIKLNSDSLLGNSQKTAATRLELSADAKNAIVEDVKRNKKYSRKDDEYMNRIQIADKHNVSTSTLDRLWSQSSGGTVKF